MTKNQCRVKTVLFFFMLIFRMCQRKAGQFWGFFCFSVFFCFVFNKIPTFMGAIVSDSTNILNTTCYNTGADDPNISALMETLVESST